MIVLVIGCTATLGLIALGMGGFVLNQLPPTLRGRASGGPATQRIIEARQGLVAAGY